MSRQISAMLNLDTPKKTALHQLKEYSQHQEALLRKNAQMLMFPNRKPVVNKPDDSTSTHARIAHQILTHKWFDPIIGLVIFANTAMIGLECELSLDVEEFEKTYKKRFEYVEYVFLGIYIVELALRFVVDGRQAFRSGWVICDSCIVVAALIELAVASALGAMENKNVQMFTIIRIGRIFRLFRAVRLFSQFRTLWMLIRGLLGCTFAGRYL